MQASFFRRYRLTFNMVLVYLLFTSFAYIGPILKPFIGEFGDMLQMLIILWPYPLILALQTWIPNPGNWVSMSIILGGLLLVLSFGLYLQTKFPSFSSSRWWVHIAAFFLWYVPLFIVQILCVLVVALLGYPIGE